MAARKKKQNNSSEPKDSQEETALDLSKLEEIKINQLITQAFARHKNEIAADKKEKLKELHHLASLVEEYLNCFLILGFSTQNEKVTLQCAHNSKDELALMDLLRTTYFDAATNRP